MKFVKTALQDADVLLVVTDVNERGMAHPETLEKIAAMDVPTFVLVNKIDLATDQTAVEAKLDAWAAKLPRASVVPISALHNFNVDTLLERIVQQPAAAIRAPSLIRPPWTARARGARPPALPAAARRRRIRSSQH